MAFVTRLRLTSDDREALEEVVTDIKRTAERKGVELTGPHSRSPTEVTVPQYRQSPPAPEDSGAYGPWRYTVYERELEIVGRDDLVRRIAERDFPDGVRVEAEVDRRAGAGN